MYKLDTPELLELARRITELHSLINNLEARYEDSKKFLYHNMAEIQKELDEVKRSKN